MPPVIVDSSKVREFPAKHDFYQWLAAHHDTETELWIRIFKVNSGVPSITPIEAIDVVLCWGWIDAIRKGLDVQENINAICTISISQTRSWQQFKNLFP